MRFTVRLHLSHCCLILFKLQHFFAIRVGGIGAIEGNEELTPLCYHLAKLLFDVLIGKHFRATKDNVERAKLALLPLMIADNLII
ncbi:hypothetical protein CASFOL_001088 [Castilleja foliolosa]|uniref:Uncharacterized protein n=1 Tax=Castilleja foliolosa TaxID=1961234 RepID=A0ABD3EM58_9LAMI